MDFKASKGGDKRVLFDVQKDGAKLVPKFVPGEDEQEANESRRQWSRLTAAINAKDMDAATEAKSAVEERERELRRQREESGEVFTPRFFALKNGRWEPKIEFVPFVDYDGAWI